MSEQTSFLVAALTCLSGALLALVVILGDIVTAKGRKRGYTLFRRYPGWWMLRTMFLASLLALGFSFTLMFGAIYLWGF